MSLFSTDNRRRKTYTITGMKYDYVYLVCIIGISNISDKEFVQPQKEVNWIS